MEDSEVKNEQILETMQEVLEKTYGDAEVTVLKTDPPMIRVWRSGAGLEVTASTRYRHSLIDISRVGRFLDTEDFPLKAGLSVAAAYAMFRIWQSQEIAANREIYKIIFIGISVAAAAYIAGRVMLDIAATKKSVKAFPVPETMRLKAGLTVQVGKVLDSMAPAKR